MQYVLASNSSGINLALLSVAVSTNEGKWWHRSVPRIATINDNKRLTGDKASSQGVVVLEELGDTNPLCCMVQSVLHITPHREREGHRWGSL